METGWICPRCNTVNAPDVKHCLCKQECKNCGLHTDWYVTIGYGSDFDGSTFCTQCIDAALHMFFDHLNSGGEYPKQHWMHDYLKYKENEN